MPLCRLCKKIFLLLCFVIPSYIVYSQSTISGEIIDSLSREKLVGANVYLVGTAFGAVADIEGRFRVVNIPDGSYTVRVSYIGSASKFITVAVSSKAEIKLNVELRSEGVIGEEVVISAQRKGQVAAINQQITSQTMVNVVSADRIKELPDANAAEAVGRLPGISLQRSAGEANKIVIRGLEPKLNSITVNGIKIPSTSSTDRSVDLSMISSESLEGIEVFKASTPDMDAEAVGGVVNLKIKKAPDEQKIQIKLSPGYNQLAHSFGDYKVTGEYSDRFFEDAVGFVTTGNFEKIDRSSESYRASFKVAGAKDSNGVVPIEGTNVTVANSLEKRERMGASLTIDYVFEGGTIWLTNFYSLTNRDPFSISKKYDPVNDRIEYTLRDRRIAIDGLSNALNGEISVWDVDLDWSLSRYNIVNHNSYDFEMVLWQGGPFDKTLSVGNVATYIPAAKNSLTNIQLHDNSDNPTKLVQTDYAGQVNLKVPFTLADFLSSSLKLGGKYTRSDRDNNAEKYGEAQYYFGKEAVTDAAAYYNKPLLLDQNGKIMGENFIHSLTNTASIVNDRYELFPIYNRDILKDWTTQQRPTYEIDRTALADNYNLREALSAGYVMVDLRFGNMLTLLTGARFEHENNEYTSVWTSANGPGGRNGIVRDTTVTRRTDHWFPHLHGKIKILEALDFRFSANRSIARPDYYWISPWVRYEPDAPKIASGNPSLKETKISNYNVSLSLYSNTVGLISVSGYYKDLRDIFYAKKTSAFRPEEYVSLGFPPNKTEPLPWTTYENADRAQIRGIELEWQTQFAFYPWMPEILKGFVFNANYSRIWSTTYFPFYELIIKNIGTPRTPVYDKKLTNNPRQSSMPGQSDEVVNISLGYDIGALSTRISYSYQGPSISEVGEIAEEDIWNKDFQRWDCTAKYKFTSWMSLNFNLVNISNQPDQAFYGSPVYQTSDFYYGMTGSASLDITF